MSEPHKSNIPPMSTDAAADLLRTGDDVGEQVRWAVYLRTRAVVDAWSAVAVLAYSLSFALSGVGGRGDAGLIPGVLRTAIDPFAAAYVVIVVVFVGSAVAEGATTHQQGLPRRKTPWRDARSTGVTALPLVMLFVLAFAAPDAPWLAVLALVAVAIAPVITLAVYSALRARDAGVRRPINSTSGPLSPAIGVGTALLGLILGGLALLPAFASDGVIPIAYVVFILILIGIRTRTFNVGRLGEEWGRTHWVAFGVSYAIILIQSVLLVRTTWDLTIVSSVCGAATALPLVYAAFRPAPIWAD